MNSDYPSDFGRIEKVIRYISRNFLSQPSLEDMARVSGLSSHHFHRVFCRWAGTTPKDFVRHLTAEHAKGLLLQSRDLLSASLDSGLSGPGRLHELMVSVEALSPGEIKARGEGIEIRYGEYESPFGPALVGLTERGVCHLSFGGKVSGLRREWLKARFIEDQKRVREIARVVFSDGGDVQVLLRGTPFQLQVWRALLKIPPGHLLSYGDIAREIGSRGASRAVGTAIGSNSVAFLIPCHRVIRESGHLGGYRWGEDRKKALLAWESCRRAAK